MQARSYARIGGVFYLVIIVSGLIGEIFVRERMVVWNDAVQTAQRIVASPQLWRVGIAADVVMHICDLPLMWIFYLLMRTVSKKLALLALLFNLIQTATLVANKLNLVFALLLAKEQPALMYVFIRAHAYGLGIGLIFFGFTCLILGSLIRKSGFLPPILGWFLQIAGACYIVNSFLLLLAPELANILFLLPSFFAELSLGLWMLIKGVDQGKWEIRANAGRAGES